MDPVTLTGKVVDGSGNPLGHATVLVYHAGVRTGYSTFCPSCYADCGKRTITAPDGTFVIRSVDPDLLFELLAVRAGFQPAFIRKVDPLKPPAPAVVLFPRTAPASPENMVRGRIVDDQGVPVRDSVILPLGISTLEFPDGRPSKTPVSIYGKVEGLEPVAVTDEQGDFELASATPALKVLLKVEARGFAPKLEALPPGADRKTLTMSTGSVVRGRLVDHGRPVAGAEIGLIPRDRGGFGSNLRIIGNPYEEMRVGTQSDGSFVLADVPAHVDWYVYAKMESLSRRGATMPVECSTTHPGEVVNVGGIQVEPGHRLNGRVVLHDGAQIPGGMRVIITADHACDAQTALIQPDGSFAFSGLPTGDYQISAAVRGYGPEEPNGGILVDRDIAGLRIVLNPERRR